MFPLFFICYFVQYVMFNYIHVKIHVYSLKKNGVGITLKQFSLRNCLEIRFFFTHSIIQCVKNIILIA